MDAPVTIMALAYHRLGIAPADQGSLNGADFDRAELPIMGGCQCCGATIAAYNACPSTSGFLRCANGCIGDDGYPTVEAANAAIFEGVLA